MGMFTDLLLGRKSNFGALSTWQQGSPLTVQTLAITSLYPGIDTDELPMFRLEAQTIPSVLAIQNLLTAAIGPLVLQAKSNTTDPVTGEAVQKLLTTQPSWITRCDRDPQQNPLLRMARTAKDMYYDGISVWTIDSKDAKGYPLSMTHLAQERWTFDDLGGINIDDQPRELGTYILFEGVFEGILLVGGRTLRTARDIERTIRSRARVGMPTQALKNLDATGSSEPDDDELQAMLSGYTTARQSLNGSVTYIPGGYDLVNLTDSPDNWLLEARSAVVADMAKITGIPSGLIEGAQFGSLNYSTELGQLSRFTDFNIKNFTDPITSRLSMGDVTPRGTTVNFDLSVLQTEAPEPLTDKGVPTTPNTIAKEAA